MLSTPAMQCGPGPLSETVGHHNCRIARAHRAQRTRYARTQRANKLPATTYLLPCATAPQCIAATCVISPTRCDTP
eukprot:11212976-Lingulodinium_polyedra.AAC.1